MILTIGATGLPTTLSSLELALANDNNGIALDVAGALGPATSTVKLTKGVLNLGGVSSSLSFNAWATDLAGGTIRGRNATCTWNGAISLSANSMLMVKSSTTVTCASAATIDLNANTLNLNAGTSGNINLNGAISGLGQPDVSQHHLGR